MTRPTRALLTLALAAASLGAGCSKGSEPPPVAPPVAPPEALPVPAGLTVQEAGSLDQVFLSWELACPDCGYELQYTAAGQTQLLPGGPHAPGTTSAYGWFAPATPELLPFQFQIRAVRGDAASGWSAPVEHLRGIRPPIVAFGAYSEVAGPRISWVNASLVADRLVVEREASGGPVATLTSTFGVTSLDDAGFMEATLNVYRVRYGAGAVWSRDAVIFATLPVRQPLDGRATVGPEGVTLSWTNRSAVAEQIAVRCTSCPRWGTLPAASTSYLDATFPPWPEATYQLEAFRGTLPLGLRPDLPPVVLPPFRIDGGLVTLDASRSPHPGFTSSPAGDGAWYRLSDLPAGPTVERLDAGGTTSFVAGGDAFLGSEPLFDGAGHPHVYTRATGGAVQAPQLGHAWHDGASWHQEVLSPPWPSVGDWFAPGVDGGGVSHVVYRAMSGQMVHGIGAAGGWTWTLLPELGDLFGSLVVTADGWAHFALPNRIWSRPPGGPWAFEDSPTSAWQVAAEGGGDLAIYGWSSHLGLVKDVVYVERRAGAWGAVETVATTNATHAVPSAARSPDGSRVFMAVSVPDDAAGSRLDLFGRVGGAWQAMRLGPTQGTVTLGFTAAGRLRATTPDASWIEP